jgi:hypothetical protein
MRAVGTVLSSIDLYRSPYTITDFTYTITDFTYTITDFVSLMFQYVRHPERRFLAVSSQEPESKDPEGVGSANAA